MPSKPQFVTIQTPDSVLNPKVGRNSTVNELFQMIPKTLLLREIWYFGLEYESKGITRYARPNKKLNAINKSGELKLRLRVCYYPEDVCEIIEDITRSYFYREVKEQIISGEIYCPSEAALLLASYQALIRHHNYDPAIHKPGYLNIEKYIPAHIRETHKFTDEEWEKKIAALHKEHGDMLEEEAMLEYLKVAQELDMYGIRYFPIRNKKTTQLWLGIGPFGLNVYTYDNKLTGELCFQWGEVRQLYMKGCKFIIKPQDRTAKNIIFYCNSEVECKEVLNHCAGNLNVFYRRQNNDESMEVQQMKAMAREAQQARETERGRLVAEREAREEAERRLVRMEQALRQQEEAFERSQAKLSTYEKRVRDLEEQLEEERQARSELEAMQRRLEEVNHQLERESLASGEERAELMRQRDAVMQEIEHQQQLLKEQQEEKARLEELVNQANNDGGKSDVEVEHELTVPEGLKIDEQVRDARTTTDKDYAKQMELMKKELDAAKDKDKLQKVDIIYEENMRQGMDKFRTLRQIRQGNTKKRVEIFECM